MELWIRSQDKKRLVKAEHIYYYEEDFTNNELKHYICIKGAYDLGVYKSKERALEVLDEIQNILKPIIKINYEYDDSLPIMNGEWLKSVKEESEIKELSTYVYEMPGD